MSKMSPYFGKLNKNNQTGTTFHFDAKLLDKILLNFKALFRTSSRRTFVLVKLVYFLLSKPFSPSGMHFILYVSLLAKLLKKK